MFGKILKYRSHLSHKLRHQRNGAAALHPRARSTHYLGHNLSLPRRDGWGAPLQSGVLDGTVADSA
jgi:hypothetical protein